MTCDACADLCHEVGIKTPGNLWAAIDVARQNVHDGIIVQVPGPEASAAPLGTLNRDGPLPDFIAIEFQCTHCGERFHLVSGTYHGSGGQWSYGRDR